MRIPFHTRLICCWLAILVLLSSTGFGMVEHWCLMRGHTKTMLAVQKSCAEPCQATALMAPMSGEPTVKKAACCKTSLSYEHLDVSSYVADYHPLPTLQPAEFIPNPQFRLLLAALLPVDTTAPALPVADDPLPKSGRFRLISLCTWLI